MITPIVAFEDNPDDQSMMSRVFKKGGLGDKVTIFDDFADFKSKVSVEDISEIQVVLLDHAMPGANGDYVHKYLIDNGFRGLAIGTSTTDSQEYLVEHGGYRVGKDPVTLPHAAPDAHAKLMHDIHTIVDSEQTETTDEHTD